jgi:hypothetical protein
VLLRTNVLMINKTSRYQASKTALAASHSQQPIFGLTN